MSAGLRPGGAEPLRRVPVLIVSGFLGSGKTTLVRDQLARARAQGLRVAVVSNEFGALGIDLALLGAGADYVELEGGCVCCQLSDALVETLERLYAEVRPDRIIVETSGVALPYETQLALWREPVARWLADDLSLVVVSAEQVRARRDLEGVFEDQVSSADLLLLNKIDLVSASELPALERELAARAPDTAIARATQARVDPDLLFLPEPGRVARDRQRPASQEAEHDHAYRAEELAIRAGISEPELRAQLAELQALRVKGFVQTDQGLRLVQGVGPRLELELARTPPPPHLIGRLVAVLRAPAPVR
jgi:cobalamin biosynthesis protein CobW